MNNAENYQIVSGEIYRCYYVPGVGGGEGGSSWVEFRSVFKYCILWRQWMRSSVTRYGTPTVAVKCRMLCRCRFH